MHHYEEHFNPEDIMKTDSQCFQDIRRAGDLLQTQCFFQSSQAGWWNDLESGTSLIEAPRIVEQKLCLIHSEVSEALEGHRKNLMDDKLPHRKMLEVELADAIIRICDLAGAMSLDLGGAIAEKLQYNLHREDHKIEHRKGDKGKGF